VQKEKALFAEFAAWHKLSKRSFDFAYSLWIL